MKALKFFTITYFVGAIVFASAFLVILLAFAGIETVGTRVNLAWPIIGGFALMMVGKYAAAATLRKTEKT